MKQLAVIGIILFFMVSVFSSCKKCYTCDFGASGGVQKFCPKDYPDGEKDLKLTVQGYQTAGYTCTAD